MKKALKKWEEWQATEKEHFEVSAAIFRDWLAGNYTEQLREDLEVLLESRLRGIHAIMPDILLLQLQYGTFGGDKIIDAIMQFDDKSISKALTILVKQGLK